MLCPFGAELFTGSGFGEAETTGCVEIVEVDSEDFGFGFGRADSLLTRTEAGTIAVSSGVC